VGADKSMTDWLESACNAIDAGIFSSDLLYVEDERKLLKDMCERWLRAISAWEAAEHDQSDL